MNLLAHAWLSFYQPEILVGNMISDYVKGNKKLAYSTAIQRGIMLHRAIDNFTDTHPVTHIAKQYFRPAYRLYAGAFVDVVYDHFLANDRVEFKDNETLETFAQFAYTILQQNQESLPDKFARTVPYLVAQNWLYHYQFIEGIEKSFGGLVRRAAYLKESEVAYSIFLEQYGQLEQLYVQFFPELKAFAKSWLQDN
jgi:acyl carrier protein phosphodiesterase